MAGTTSKAIFEKYIPQIGVTPSTDLLISLFGDIAAFFNVERVGYSRMEPDRSAIQQEVQFYLSSRRCDTTHLPRLRAEDYPGYFEALETQPGVVIANDVMRDHRLREFWEGYFRPLNIVSMLDVPVHRAGQLYGVICHEQVGEQRHWTEEEVAAACSFAHLVALAIETEERQKAQEALRSALEREREVVEMKSNFVSLVSHEFRTPLGVLVSSADILDSYFERLTPSQRTSHLRDIRHSAYQMSSLMEEVLLLGKVESGRMDFRQVSLPLHSFCQRIVEEVTSATNQRCPIQLQSHGLPETAHGDEALLRHILTNLLTNAVKYSPDGSPVTLRMHREGSTARFEIHDQGIGIDPRDHKHLFTAFQRGRNVGAIPGTGLGLVIVRRCVERHGGAIEFTSAPGEGSRFVVRLPLFTAPIPEASQLQPHSLS